MALEFLVRIVCSRCIDAGDCCRCCTQRGLFVCVCVTLRWSRQWNMQKWLNRSRCRLDGRLLWSQGTMSLSLDGVHAGATWQIRLNYPCSVAMLTVVTTTLATCLHSWSFQSRSCVYIYNLLFFVFFLLWPLHVRFVIWQHNTYLLIYLSK